MSDYTVIHEKAKRFYDIYERKAELQHQTHYCPGCGHGIVHKLLAEAIDALGIQDRTILVTPVGCSVFGYYYFDVGNIQVAHGRAPAVATGVKRSRPGSIVVAYQGDGDLAAIGTAEIVHAANRGEGITVIFVNNGIYGMTGGQMAPTTPLGRKSTTTPFGRTAENEGYPDPHVRAAECAGRAGVHRAGGAGLQQADHAGGAGDPAGGGKPGEEARVFVRGSALAMPDHLEDAAARSADATCGRKWRGFSGWPTRATGARRRWRGRSTRSRRRVEELPRILGLSGTDDLESSSADPMPLQHLDMRIKVAGFGGQGVLMLGEVLAEAGLDAGYEVSWLPSYGPEMRSGTSNCHVRLASEAIDSPLVSRPNLLLAMNEPSLRKFLPAMETGGLALYNGPEVPPDCVRPDVRMMARPFTEIADRMGASKVANIVMLGALLEATGLLEEERVIGALRRLVKSPKLLDLDVAALARGREALAGGDDYLWGV